MAHPPSDIPSTMRAWTYSRRGLPTKTIKLAEVPVPSLPSPTSVLVRVSHVALHPGTCLLAQLVPAFFRKYPAIAETDFSGTIVKVGDGVPADPSGNALQAGTPVFGTLAVPAHISTGAGTLAEYVAVESATIAVKPDVTPFDLASGCGVSAATALVLVDAAQLHPGARVLLMSPCGGIGTFATQLTRKAIGPEGHIVGICSGANENLAKQLGCDAVIAYDQLPAGTNLPEYISNHYSLESGTGGFDAIVDAYGSQPLWHGSSKYLKPGNEHPYASVGVKASTTVTLSSMLGSIWGMVCNSFWPVWLGGVPRAYNQVTMFVDDKTMGRVKKELEAGSFTAHIGGRWKFEDAKQAYEEYLHGHARGKLVVEVGNFSS